ncbi:MAG: hypothetical protein K2Y21_14460 [Phycisphaerales bacterium]|nr:hypothetical protein [Phycisphaerales bacterium]
MIQYQRVLGVAFGVLVACAVATGADLSGDDKPKEGARVQTSSAGAPPTDQTPPGPFTPGEIEAASRLSADAPERYLELGEDILDRPDAPERVEMARQLFVRAVEYGRRKSGSQRAAASAAIALASMSAQPSQRQWLRAIAAILHPDYPAATRTERADGAAAARAAEVLTRLRAGEGPRPRELLADPAVRAVLARSEPSLSAEGTIAISDLDAAAKKQPCPACSGRFLVTPQGPRVTTLCPTCKGRSFLAFGDRDLAVQLRLQLKLLGEAEEQWGSQSETAIAPARDPNPAEVAIVYGVDPKLTTWRDGRWRAGADEPAAK